MPSLHENGWRQGSVFKAHLIAISYAYVAGEAVTVDHAYEQWVVVSQDCDLASVDSKDNELLVEVMPALTGNGGGGWGIRSRALRLSQGLHTDSRLPKLRLSPAALGVYIESIDTLDTARTIALKTWLGLRYDRPAVPTVLNELARERAAAVRKTRTSELSAATHDVLFGATEERPSRFQLIAVIVHESHAAEVREWMTAAALEVDPALGSLGGPPEALTKDELTLADIENTFSADLSDISWRKSEPKGPPDQGVDGWRAQTATRQFLVDGVLTRIVERLCHRAPRVTPPPMTVKPRGIRVLEAQA